MRRRRRGLGWRLLAPVLLAAASVAAAADALTPMELLGRLASTVAESPAMPPPLAAGQPQPVPEFPAPDLKSYLACVLLPTTVLPLAILLLRRFTGR